MPETTIKDDYMRVAWQRFESGREALGDAMAELLLAIASKGRSPSFCQLEETLGKAWCTLSAIPFKLRHIQGILDELSSSDLDQAPDRTRLTTEAQGVYREIALLIIKLKAAAIPSANYYNVLRGELAVACRDLSECGVYIHRVAHPPTGTT